MKRQATVKGNTIIATRKADGTYKVVFKDSFKTYGDMVADELYGGFNSVASIAHEMADNNDIGRALATKIVKAFTR